MVDYSRWNNIEISDDEDDTHPNIDTPSLFRWRHQARVERMEEHKYAKEALEKRIAENEALRKKKDLPSSEIEKLTKEAQELQIAKSNLLKHEKKIPLNVDTLSQPKFSKTVINKKEEVKDYDDMNDEEKEQHMKKFVKENEEIIKKYGMLRKFDDSKQFLMANNLLVHENTANYLVIWCINLEMEDKHDLMTHVAHQCICMQYMLELSRQLKCDPRSCIVPFFERIQVADVEYRKQFDDEIAAFIGRIERRAKEKIAEALKEQEEEEAQERLKELGPGGLHPADVFETLPKELQECFEKRDTELLKEVIAKMPEEDAKYHIKRCVDSGLWVPDASQMPQSQTEADDDEVAYEEIPTAAAAKKEDLDLD